MRRVIAALLLASSAARAQPAPDVLIGVIVPRDAPARAAVATALAVVDERHAPVPGLMGRGGGLARLGGAALRERDGSADDPARAEAEAERLITVEHVSALLVDAPPAQREAIARVGARHHVPSLTLGPSPAVSDGLVWSFNLAPTGATLSAALFAFLHDQAGAIGHPVHRIGLVYEDRPAVVALSDVQRRLADAAGLQRVVQLNLLPDAPGLATEVETIVEQKPDALIATLGTGNALLLVRSLVQRHALPPLLGQGGFCADPAFLAGLGPAADGVVCATSFAPDAVAARPAMPPLQAAFEARAGLPMDAHAAELLTATLVLADAVERAGSADPLDLRAALLATDVAGADLPVAWRGVRFDASGQNALATPALRQMQAGAYRTVSPAPLAVATPTFP